MWLRESGKTVSETQKSPLEVVDMRIIKHFQITPGKKDTSNEVPSLNWIGPLSRLSRLITMF